MLRSMYAGISGMKGFQTKLDVIGNNIANVNTAGFKKGRVTFQDMMSQTTSGAQGPTATRGGVNPKQVGLGSQLGTIDNVHTQGFRQTTERPLDLSLEGDGMFVVANDLGDTLEDSNVSYTRAGNFYLDEEGSVVNPQGQYLMGFPSVENGKNLAVTNKDTDVKSIISINTNDQTVTATDKDGNQLTTTSDFGTGNISVTDKNGNQINITINNSGEIEAPTYNNGNDVDYTETPMVEADTGNTSTLTIPESAQSFNIQSNGTINYIDKNGDTQVAGKVAIANFSNPAGLQKAGSNLFLNSQNAGYTGLVEPETEGTASIVSGSLEMSNVDLASQFTEMITAQRGFQANTRIITTSDEILQELVNLKR